MNEFNYKDNYINWLKNNIDEYKVDDNIYRITLPFTDSNNTETEVYIIKEGNNDFTITDDGYTFSELEFLGFDFSTPRRKEIIHSLATNYGVSIGESNELYVKANSETLAFKKHLLIQCMIKISDLCILSPSNIKTLFNEDVENFFDNNDIRYMKDLSFTGKSMLQSNYDFGIGKTKNSPERIIKLINNLDSQHVKSAIFSWEDVKDVRPKDTKLITIINDNNKKISKTHLTALNEYGINTFMWSDRMNKSNMSLLTA